MKQYDIIIFDLDGVLIDQSVGITNSVSYALLKSGVVENDYGTLLRFIGPPLKKSFMEIYYFDENTALKAVEYYREIYKQKGIKEFIVYSGVDSMLQALNKQGKKLFVATTKPKIYADEVLKYANLYTHFQGIYGDTLTFDVTKSLMIKNILNDINTQDLSKVVMIGDKDSDVFAARDNNIDSIGVTYGFGSRIELDEANPTYLIRNVKELEKLLIN